MASPIPAGLCEDSPFSPVHKMRNLEDDDSSLWSVQVNVSSPNPVSEQAQDEEEEEEEKKNPDEEQEIEEEYYDEEEDEDEYEELCEGLSGISVQGRSEGLHEFVGRHTRFVYNSDDEVEEEVECEKSSDSIISPSVTRLRGLPTPKGKHLRFSDEDGDGNDNDNDTDTAHSAQ